MQKGELFVWSHPFDFHFKVNELSGFHELSCEMWTPYGDWKFGALSFYMDSTPRLNNLNILSKDL